MRKASRFERLARTLRIIELILAEHPDFVASFEHEPISSVNQWLAFPFVEALKDVLEIAPAYIDLKMCVRVHG